MPDPPGTTGGYLPAVLAQTLRSILRRGGVTDLGVRRALTELAEAVHAAGGSEGYARGYADGVSDHEDDQQARAMQLGVQALADPLRGPSPLMVDEHHDG